MRTFIAVIAACLLCACSHEEKSSATLKSVYVTTPEGGEGTGSLNFTGVVEEDDNISIGFKTPGQIKKILVKEGDHVRTGQLLAVLDDEDYKLGVEALQIQYDQVKDEVARAARLFEKKSMTANDYEKATAGLKQLGVQLQVNKNKLAYTRLYAPAAGIIESVNFSPAEMVDAGTAVFTMIGKGVMEVVCDIPANTYFNRDNISSVSCSTPHAEGTVFPLRILSIVPKADSNQLYRMRLAAGKEGASALTSGMNVEVKVEMSGNGSDGLMVPTSSVFKRGNETCVWVLKPDSTVTARKITLEGTIDGNVTTVGSGLSSSDRIIRAGVSMLHEGEKVKVVAKPSETNVGGLL